MPDKVLSESEARLNREALRHIPAWLRLRDLTQRDLAERMSVSEATVSKWLQGKQSMTVAQFVAISRILGASPEEALMPPQDTGAAYRYREIAEIVDSLSPEDLAAFVAIGRSLQKKRR